MTDYDGIVRSLKQCASDSGNCNKCNYQSERNCSSLLGLEAADAITRLRLELEEANRRVDFLLGHERTYGG